MPLLLGVCFLKAFFGLKWSTINYFDNAQILLFATGPFLFF
ncbi:hypothetical protein C900_04643 [Fulvivirga imtechensis AK7]|uniref:Uncharacterized protein n=1 Tax=Fulvivirga imtechensis AK7 TaxID=1237149 RepID=L8JLK0_9BACT|nr:hypothetical protein C900_04643 [Fulvivirga imtechensis AK7]